MSNYDQMELRRLASQEHLDSQKTTLERNRMGQYATPTALADDILQYSMTYIEDQRRVRFLDPAIGTGAFFSALLRVIEYGCDYSAVGYEIDDHYGNPARELWAGFPLEIRSEDFTHAKPPEDEATKATLVVCNPPYIRHHHIPSEEKRWLGESLIIQHGTEFSGLSGMYCYFLCLSKNWMANGGIGVWLVPGEFMSVNYGTALRRYLLNKVTLLHIHRFEPDDVQFADALVSSVVLCIKNEKPAKDHKVRFTQGGSLLDPLAEEYHSVEYLRSVKKWTNLSDGKLIKKNTSVSHRKMVGDYFSVKRGIATGANDYFILTPSEAKSLGIPSEFLTPILPSPRCIEHDIVGCNEEGLPILDSYGLLFSCVMPEDRLKSEYPMVWSYLQEGRLKGISERYICHSRHPWYSQEKREPTQFLCTYMGRGKRDGSSRPFRFILNHSKAIVSNVYLMLYPKPSLKNMIQQDPQCAYVIWKCLNSIPIYDLLNEGRVYGGGLCKMEPKELMCTPMTDIDKILPDEWNLASTGQLSLF